MDAASRHGRETAFRIAREESIRRLDPAAGSDWSAAHVRRFRYRADDPDEFTSRSLVALLEHAVLSHRRRVDAALASAAHARTHAEHAEGAAWGRAEEALQLVREPQARHAMWQALRAYASRADKEASKLRRALEALEKETAWAQSSHTAALRVVAARLIAQQDAGVACVLSELEDAEKWGPDALNALTRSHSAVTTILTRELAGVEASAGSNLREALDAQREQHARQLRRAECERQILSSALGAAEAAAIHGKAAAREQSAALGAQSATLVELQRRVEESREAIEQHDELTRRAAEGEAAATEARKEARRHAALVRNAEQREQGLQAEAASLAAREKAMRERLGAVERKAASEQAELKASLARAAEQNDVLRARLVMLHATIHGMHDRQSPYSERLRKGREEVDGVSSK